MINGLTYNQLAVECHHNNMKWWIDINTGERLVRNKGQLIMLVVSEIAEAMEGERKGLMDDKLPHRPAAEVELVDAIIRLADFAGGFGYDVSRPNQGRLPLYNVHADKGEALLRIVKTVSKIHDLCERRAPPAMIGEQIFESLEIIRQYAAYWGYDLSGAYREKTAFNKVRKDHSVEARKEAGGKKW